jgi:hypothetical protein
MKKLLLAGIAVLFLATGAAHAAEGDFNCDRLPKYYLGGHFSTEKTTKDATFTFVVGFSNNRERQLPGEEMVIRYNMRTGKLWINGNQCKWDKPLSSTYEGKTRSYAATIFR